MGGGGGCMGRLGRGRVRVVVIRFRDAQFSP